MPRLILEDFPGEIYERIQRRAEAENRSLADEVIRLLEEGLNGSESKGAISVTPPKVAESPRLPDPPILDTGEISPPCTLPRPGVGVQVATLPGGMRRPTSIIIFEEESEPDHV